MAEQERIGEIACGRTRAAGPNRLGLMNYGDGFAARLFSRRRRYRVCRKAPAARLRSSRRAAGSATIWKAGWQHATFRLCWISTGNEAGLGLADFIQYLLDDPVTQVIVLYAEDIRRPQEFIAIAGEALRRGKPIVMMHPGRSARAKEAARSHTGALAGDHAVMRTVVEHAGAGGSRYAR